MRDKKDQKLPARLISSELSAHQMSPCGDSAPAESSRTRAHGRHQPMSLRILKCTDAVEELPQSPQGTTASSLKGGDPRTDHTKRGPLGPRAGIRVITATASRPEAVGWAPSVLAGPLTTSGDCGSAASCHRAMVDSAEGAATLRPTK